MWQDLTVGAVVALAVVYALWYWMPAALRRRLGAVRPAWAKAPGCGACSDCGGCAKPKAAPLPPPAPGADPGPAQAPGPVRDPLWMAERR